MTKTVAIHQPNFFPWLGYFDKIARADIFIFFDDVQFPKTGGVWTNRVKLLISGEARWMTGAIDRNYNGTRAIREMCFLTDNPWREKILKSIMTNYQRHPFFNETMTIIKPLLLNPEPNIAEYNIKAVTRIVRELGLDPAKLRRSSDFPAEGHSNELLCSLTRLAGGETYMCGGGADGYQDDELFEQRGVKLQYQNFSHPVYPQRGQQEFVAGLSVIDALMNLGWKGVGGQLSVPRY
jgi:hypothetical protein